MILDFLVNMSDIIQSNAECQSLKKVQLVRAQLENMKMQSVLQTEKRNCQVCARIFSRYAKAGE